jgi:DNA (cytosine-5)-methyltransferase 1
MTHGSLFSGIGGFDLAAEWMGWENKFHCEWNEFGQKVLKHYWPEAESFHDITKTDFTKYANRIDILTGGFPCQPYSMAGKRKGKDDERHLWPEMLRCIREVKPRWVVGENVLGLVNWSGGLVFHEVQADLEAQGYEVFPYVLPAASVNAPHRRDRVWFIAYSNNNDRRINIGEIFCESSRFSKKQITSNSNNNGLNQCYSGDEIQSSERGFNALGDINESNGNGDVTDTTSIRFSTEMENGELERRERFTFCNQRNKWDSFPTVSPLCPGDDGLSNRLDSITFSKWRKESIKAGGNAIVPQVAFQIFKTIEQFEQLNKQA